MSESTVDLAIIGSGSGNSIPDDRLADRHIAIFEEGVYGGTCLNVGCIPTKMFVYAADVADSVRNASRYGVHARFEGAHWPAIVERVFGRIDPISEGGKNYRIDDCDNIDVYDSYVTFDGRDDEDRYRLVTAAGDTVHAKEVVVAAGSRPLIPDVIANSDVPYHTSDDIMRLSNLPNRLTILGSGYIAAEFAHIFASLGTEVTIIARGPALLRHLDTDISQRFTQIAQRNIDVRLNTDIVDAAELPDGGARLIAADGTTIDSDVLLVAVGRTPNGDRLNLESIGLHVDEGGLIPRDEHGRTAATGVWTLGDVSSPYQLKHVANHEQRIVLENLVLGWDSDKLHSFDHRFVPAAVFTHPQIAAVGLTEEEARASALDVTVKIQDYADIAYGWAMEDTTGICKVIAEKGTGRLIGVHIIGPQAPTVIQPAIQAMSFGLSAQDMARGQYWIHPAVPEVLENALLGLEI